MKVVSAVLFLGSFFISTGCDEISENQPIEPTESLALSSKGKSSSKNEVPPPDLSICADFDQSGTVDANDDKYLLDQFETIGTIGMDLNFDGVEDIVDLALAIEFRRSSPAEPNPKYCETGNCYSATSLFQNIPLQSSGNRVEVRFQATPSNLGIDGVLMLADQMVSNYPDAAIRVRFSQANTIQARNGLTSQYNSGAVLNYIPNTPYNFRFEIDFSDQVFDLFVSKTNEDEVQIASSYGFSNSMNMISYLGTVSNGGSVRICDLQIRTISQDAPATPTPPTNLTLSRLNENIQLSWTDNSNNETSFEIEKTFSNNAPALVSVASNSTSYADSASTPGTYTYRIRAVNAAGASVYTSPQSLNISPPQQTNDSLSSLPQDTEGFTIMNPSIDSRMIFVGTTADVPADVRSQFADRPNQILTASTVAAGLALMRAGYPDHLHLKRGQIFNQALGGIDALRGRSSAERAVIKSYGDPALDRPTFNGNSSIASCITVNTRSEPRYLLITDIACKNFSSSGIEWKGRGSDIHLENLSLTGTYQNMSVFPVHDVQMTGRVLSNLTLRRSYLAGARGARGQGLYMSSQHDSSQSPPTEPIHIRNVLIEENTFYDNGTAGSAQAHNLYIGAGVRGVVIHNNISLNAASHGLLSRAAGQILNNLIAKSGVGIQWGSGGLAQDGDCCDPLPSEPLTGDVEDNVLLDGRNVASRATIGAQIFWIAGGGMFRRNIFANDLSTMPYALGVSISKIGSQPAEINDVDLTNNIFYNWHAGISFTSPVSLRGLNISDNQFYEASPPAQYEGAIMKESNVTISSSNASGNGNMAQLPSSTLLTNISSSIIGLQRTALSYPDSSRTIEKYQQSLSGTANYDAFLAKLRSQDRSRWDSRYSASRINAYIRNGFDLLSPRD